jgi:hypothetical protein
MADRVSELTEGKRWENWKEWSSKPVRQVVSTELGSHVNRYSSGKTTSRQALARLHSGNVDAKIYPAG